MATRVYVSDFTKCTGMPSAHGQAVGEHLDCMPTFQMIGPLVRCRATLDLGMSSCAFGSTLPITPPSFGSPASDSGRVVVTAVFVPVLVRPETMHRDRNRLESVWNRVGVEQIALYAHLATLRAIVPDGLIDVVAAPTAAGARARPRHVWHDAIEQGDGLVLYAPLLLRRGGDRLQQIVHESSNAVDG